MVDVRDLAAAHIAAMEIPAAAGKRFIVCKSPGMWMRELSEVIAGEFESQGYKIPSWHIPKPGLWLAKFFSPVLARVYSGAWQTIHIPYRQNERSTQN